MIKAENLSMIYGKDFKAVDDLSFEIKPGEIVGFAGPNGAGKTTVIKMLTGILKPASGRALINGFDIVKEPIKAKESFAYVADNPDILLQLTGLEYINYIADVYKVPSEDREKRIMELSERFGFRDYENEKLKDLSAGQRRRVELAAAFILNSELIILDEPDVGLDEAGKQVFEDIVKEKVKQGVTFLITSHNLTEVSNLSDRLVVLSEGKLMFYGNERMLRSRYLPVNTMTVTYDGAIPNIDDLPIVRYRIDGNTVSYDYNSKYITASELINVLMKQVRVLDVKIKKPDLEQIILNRS